MSEQKPVVAVVTGASRGAGRGIAVGLGSHGCTVYVTGRSEKTGDASLPGTIYATADAVTAAGGKGVLVRVDHGDDAQVKALFEQVQREQGRLDILVNNACAIHDQLTAPGNFWEKPMEIGNMITVGVRSSFVASYYAAPMMVAQKRGLVIFTSGSGAVHYVFGPAYGAHKAGMDKLAADMAVDFKNFSVAALSIWMGALLTERMAVLLEGAPEKKKALESIFETPEFTGHIIWRLYSDPRADEDERRNRDRRGNREEIRPQGRGRGRQPASYRETHGVAPRVQYPAIVR